MVLTYSVHDELTIPASIAPNFAAPRLTPYEGNIKLKN